MGSRGNRELVLPLADDEAFWIGLSVIQSRARYILQIIVELAEGAMLDALSGEPFQSDGAAIIAVPDIPRVVGIRVDNDLFRVFARATGNREMAACSTLTIRVLEDTSDEPPPADSGKSLRVELVDYETFEAQTGLRRPEPLDPENAYKGWLLP